MTTNENVPKVPKVYSCETCHYLCSSKKDFNKHLVTRKHINTTNATTISLFIPKNYNCCNCGNIYKHSSSLCKHKKTCIKENITMTFIPIIEPVLQRSPNDENIILSNLMRELVQSNQDLAKQTLDALQQNKELQKHVIELCKNGTHNTTNNNKSFNINLFLNEQCKNAINLQDFIKSIEVSHEDLMNNKQLGFVGGISKILIDHIQQLGINERPIHCTDFKRDTVYIKENNEWNKDDDNEKINKVIQEVSRKSINTLMDWKKTNPDSADCNSVFSNNCDHIIRSSIAGFERGTLYPKVMKELNRKIIINKENLITK